MIVKGSDVLGIKVIAENENKNIGTIKDLVYDPNKNKVTDFLLSLGDVLTEAKVIPLKEVRKITQDTVIVKSQKSVKPASKAIKPTSTSSGKDSIMQNTEILNAQGQDLGTFQDIYFDSKTGQVGDYEVLRKAQGEIKVPVKKVVASSPEKTIIKETGQSQRSGGIVGKIKDLIG